MSKIPRIAVVLLIVALLAVALPAGTFAAPAAQGGQYTGHVVRSDPNCGLTQIYGTVVDGSGNPKTGVKLQIWWADGSTTTTSGSYVRPETNAAGFDFTMNTQAVANTWEVAVVDDSGNLLSPRLAVTTTSECSGSSAANAVKVEFREGAAAPSPAPEQPPAGSEELPALPAPPNTEAAPPLSSDATCEFFTEAAGGNGGFSVCDDDTADFLDAFEDYGLQNVGYPISRRFVRDGFITQAFQKAVFQWRSDGDYVAFVNVFDELNQRGYDQRLMETRQTPFQLPAGWEGINVLFEQAVALRQALLNERPALRSAYFSVGDPLLFFGLPTSEVEDMGNHYAIRLQRAVLQEWKEDVPWASAGEVTVANGGDIAKELGHLPGDALLAETSPGGSTVAAPVPAPPSEPVAAPAPPAPAPPVGEPARNLDPRLGAIGVGIAPADVQSGQEYWRVVEIIWHDSSQSGGRHALYVDVMDKDGFKLIGQPVTVWWGGGSVELLTEPKPFPEYSLNYPMYRPGCSYNVRVEGAPSETVTCLGLGDMETREWRTDHTEFLIKFQKVVKP